jgi:hypothetical protein
MPEDTLTEPKPGGYASFLVRVRQEPGEMGSRRSQWRGSVESIQNGQKEHFTDMESLIRFIREVSREQGISLEKEYIA